MGDQPTKNLRQLFLGVLTVSAFTFGGGFVIVTFLKKKFVDELEWLDEAEMLDYIALAQSTPGSIAVNASILLGWNTLGLPGMLVAVLAWVYQKYRSFSFMQSVLSSLRPVVVALIASAGISVLREAIWGSAELLLQHVDWMSAVCFIASFMLIRKVRWNPILAMAASGAVYTVVHLIIPT